jgi:hypothetical protein
MAKIVLGIGSSHSPTLLMEPTAWRARAERDDRTTHALHDFDGKLVTYDELLAQVSPGVLAEIEPDVLNDRHEANQKAMKEVEKVLVEVDPDVVIVVGDDHKEVFQEDNMPSLSVYWGQTIPYKPQGLMKWKYDETLRQNLWYPQEEHEYPVASGFARRLIENLVTTNFDVAHSKFYKPGQGMSHSFGFVYYKLMTQKTYPIIPVSINTYYPPNQITPARAFQLGGAIRKAVESWPEDLRVAIVATGGLSHFVVDEKFDREFLDLLASGDIGGHQNIPLEKLQSGNSEFRCWSALAGAVAGMKMNLIDYVPCYRSPAGTGCAMAFATWQ